MDSGNRGFVALGGRTRAAMIAIACVPAFGIVTNLQRIAFGDSIAAHSVSRVMGLFFLADVLALALACVSAAVLFSVWLHRAVGNLAALGRTEMRYSPADAVVSFFIPFVNFVRPLRVMKELWLATEPGVQADGYDWQGTAPPRDCSTPGGDSSSRAAL